MMAAPPIKKEYHFAGAGIWHNLTVLAENIEEATGIWHRTKQPINPGIPVLEVPAEQSTPMTKPEQEETGVQ